MSRYKVMVDDNFHFMDEAHRCEWKNFPTVQEAMAECKRIFDSDLDGYLKPGITAAELYDLYESFGADPSIVCIDSNAEPAHFLAWGYAKERSDTLAAADEAKSKTASIATNETAREKFARKLSTDPMCRAATKSGQGFIILGAGPSAGKT